MQKLKATRSGAATGQKTGRSYKYQKGEIVTCKDGDLAHYGGDFEEIAHTENGSATDPAQTVAADGDTHTVPDDSDPEKQTDPTTPGIGNEPGTKATPEPDTAPERDPDTGDEVLTEGADPANPNDTVRSGPDNEAVRAADDDNGDDEKDEPEVGPTQTPEREPVEPTTEPGKHDTRPFEPANIEAGPFAVGDSKTGGYYYVNDAEGNRVEDADGEPIVAGQGKDKAEAQVEAVNATLPE